MLFHTHILLGILFFLLFQWLFKGGNELFFFGLVLLGSVLPDIDSRYSKINQWSGFIGKIIAIFSKHRGLFHSFFFHLFLFFLLSFFFPVYYASGLFLGYLAHILGDSLTRQGVVIFYPFSRYKIRGPVRVGGFVEGVLLVIIAALIVVLLVG